MVSLFNVRFLKMLPEATKTVVVCVVLKLLALVAQVASFVVLAGAIGAGSLPTGGLLTCAAFIVAYFLLSAAARRAGSVAGSRAAATLTKDLFSKVVELGPARARVISDAECTTLMGEGVSRLRPYFASYLPQFFFALLAPLVSFCALAPTCLPAALVMLLCVPLIPGSIMMFMKQAKRFMGEYWGTYVDLSGSFLDAIRGLTMLKGYRADGRWHRRLDAEAEEFRQVTMRLLNVQLGNVTLMDLFTYGGMAAGIAVAWGIYAAGGLDLSGLALVVLLAPGFFTPMRSFGSLFHTGMNANAVIDQALALLDAPLPARGEKDCAEGLPAIEVEGASFAYSDGMPALKDVALEVPFNSLVGLTGASGGGKSTMARLVAGLLGADYQGSVRVCGIELREIDPASLRSVVTYVGPSTHVFKGSVRSNLRLAKPEATESELWGALKNAQLDNFVLARGGLDMEVAEGGRNLSGGQRQRLCFARALLRDTPIYVFDEVASNIDQVSETAINDGIQRLSVHKTILQVSHRLLPLAWADEIYVMGEGQVLEHGEHQVLLARGGAYRRLWDQLAELESLARVSGVEYDQETYVPSEAELKVAKIAARRAIPLMGGRAMEAALEVMSYRRYFEAPTADVPDGHPAWIPLPDYGEKPEKAGSDSNKAQVSDSVEPGKPVGGSEAPAATAPVSRGALATIRGLVGLTSDMTGEVALASVLGALGIAMAAAVPTLGVLGAAGVVPALLAAVCLAAAAVVRGILHRRERLLTHDQTFRTLALIRSRLFGKLRELAPARLASRDTGELIGLLTSDVELLEGVYSRSLGPCLSASLAAAATTVALAFVAPALGLVALLAFATLGIALPALSARLTSARAREISGYGALMTTFLLDCLSGMDDLAQCGRADEYAAEMDAHVDSLDGGEKDLSLATAALAAAGDAGALAFTCAAVAAGLSAAGPVAALAATAVLQAVLFPVVDCGRLGFSLQATLAAAERVLDVLDENPETQNIAGESPAGLFACAGLESASFAYADGDPALSDLSLRVEKGQVLRLIGPSGVGKSTALRLLMRWWDPDAGAAYLNERHLFDVNSEDLRAAEAFMEQDTYLLAGTLRENILVAAPGATEAEFARAIKDAALADVAARLPQGLETPVGEGGSPLSDGERQRVGLARAFISGAELLLLDEPTSNLDALSEAAVLGALAKNRGQRTVVVATHRRAVASVATDTLVLQGDRRS
ncbi:ATP-binding cassette domain-containing protein [Paratractidigestivibacter sp.]|uniref:ATP-binding cassette domain-containing protein n=1 Tax=Paratractidigestivibacter sp. TaxID=2847316 RepID=UPI002ACB0A86|nr:ATP-binding cassette domain-containing protein [Paratractidigestivibacter sp.]